MRFKFLKLKYKINITNVATHLSNKMFEFEKQLSDLTPDSYDNVFMVDKTLIIKEINTGVKRAEIKYTITLNGLDSLVSLNSLISEMFLEDTLVNVSVEYSSRPYKRTLKRLITFKTDNEGNVVVPLQEQRIVFASEFEEFLDEAQQVEARLEAQSV